MALMWSEDVESMWNRRGIQDGARGGIDVASIMASMLDRCGIDVASMWIDAASMWHRLASMWHRCVHRSWHRCGSIVGKKEKYKGMTEN